MIATAWQPVLDLMQEGRFDDAVAAIDTRRIAAPLDGEALLLRGVAHVAAGRLATAETDYWRALAIDPRAGGVRAALGDLVVRDLAAPPEERDFSLTSGERQTAPTVAGIRRDHRERYQFAARVLRGVLPVPHDATGLDVFCGNGYGSRILADRCGCRMIGLDASGEAVALAEQVYGDHRVVFRQAYFPFGLAERVADFAVMFESIEHVAGYEDFLATVDAAVRGPLLVSFPLESGLCYARNADLFRMHVRHFTLAEMSDLLARVCGRRITSALGQNTYRLADGRLAGHLPEAAMGLGPLRPDSQFAVVVAERD